MAKIEPAKSGVRRFFYADPDRVIHIGEAAFWFLTSYAVRSDDGFPKRRPATLAPAVKV